MITLALSTLLTIPLAKTLTSQSKKETIIIENPVEELKLKNQVFIALKDKSYIYLHLGFLLVDFMLHFYLHIFLVKLHFVDIALAFQHFP